MAQIVRDELRRIIGDYVEGGAGSPAAADAASYAVDAAARLMKLWETSEFDGAMEAAKQNIALIAGMAGHDQQQARREQMLREGQAALLMAVRIGVALALA